MYHIDPNINTAVEKRAERLRALRASDYTPVPERFAPEWGRPESGRSKWIGRAALALGAALPIVVIVLMVALTAR
jgi:hypothetical protein